MVVCLSTGASGPKQAVPETRCNEQTTSRGCQFLRVAWPAVKRGGGHALRPLPRLLSPRTIFALDHGFALSGRHISAMAHILFTCPTTFMQVQRRLEDGEDMNENEYELITCPACARLHFFLRIRMISGEATIWRALRPFEAAAPPAGLLFVASRSCRNISAKRRLSAARRARRWPRCQELCRRRFDDLKVELNGAARRREGTRNLIPRPASFCCD